MARARPRYVITGNMRANGHDLRGQRVVCLGECTSFGRLANSKPKPYKHEITHMLFRYEDRKFWRTLGMSDDTFTMQKGAWMDKMLTPAEDYAAPNAAPTRPPEPSSTAD